MKSIRVASLALILAFSSLAAGCITSGVLHLPGDLARPGARSQKGAGAGAPVAVLDFAWSGSPSGEIGRDFDGVRPIVWKGAPGKAVPDLIASVLAEKGVRAVRVAGEADVPADAAAKVWGTVDEFRVNAKRSGTVKVEAAACVSATVHGQAPGAPSRWSTSASCDYRYDDPLFVTPEGVRDAVNGAANAVAEEAVRRLAAAGVVNLPAAPPAGPQKGAGPQEGAGR